MKKRYLFRGHVSPSPPPLKPFDPAARVNTDWQAKTRTRAQSGADDQCRAHTSTSELPSARVIDPNGILSVPCGRIQELDDSSEDVENAVQIMNTSDDMYSGVVSTKKHVSAIGLDAQQKMESTVEPSSMAKSKVISDQSIQRIDGKGIATSHEVTTSADGKNPIKVYESGVVNSKIRTEESSDGTVSNIDPIRENTPHTATGSAMKDATFTSSEDVMPLPESEEDDLQYVDIPTMRNGSVTSTQRSNSRGDTVLTTIPTAAGAQPAVGSAETSHGGKQDCEKEGQSVSRRNPRTISVTESTGKRSTVIGRRGKLLSDPSLDYIEEKYLKPNMTREEARQTLRIVLQEKTQESLRISPRTKDARSDPIDSDEALEVVLVKSRSTKKLDTPPWRQGKDANSTHHSATLSTLPASVLTKKSKTMKGTTVGTRMPNEQSNQTPERTMSGSSPEKNYSPQAKVKKTLADRRPRQSILSARKDDKSSKAATDRVGAAEDIFGFSNARVTFSSPARVPKGETFHPDATSSKALDKPPTETDLSKRKPILARSSSDNGDMCNDDDESFFDKTKRNTRNSRAGKPRATATTYKLGEASAAARTTASKDSDDGGNTKEGETREPQTASVIILDSSELETLQKADASPVPRMGRQSASVPGKNQAPNRTQSNARVGANSPTLQAAKNIAKTKGGRPKARPKASTSSKKRPLDFSSPERDKEVDGKTTSDDFADYFLPGSKFSAPKKPRKILSKKKHPTAASKTKNVQRKRGATDGDGISDDSADEDVDREIKRAKQDFTSIDSYDLTLE